MPSMFECGGLASGKRKGQAPERAGGKRPRAHLKKTCSSKGCLCQETQVVSL